MQYEQDLIEMPSGVPTLAEIDAARTKLQVFFLSFINDFCQYLSELTRKK